MALKINGKDDELRRRDFRAFASVAAVAADAAMEEPLKRLDAARERTLPPALPDYGPNGREIAEATLAIVHDRTHAFD